MINPYEPPQQEKLSAVIVEAEAASRGDDRATINGRIVRKCFLLTTPLLFIFCGIFGAIYNPRSMWSGNEVGRIENFFAHAWPISVAPGVVNMLFWPLAFMVIFAASFIQPLMSEGIGFSVLIGIIGSVFVIYGVVAPNSVPGPMLLGDGCGIIFFAITTARAIRSSR